MSNQPISQSQKRFLESIAALFQDPASSLTGKSLVFIKSSSDIGVVRNGGRNGARLAPQSFLAAFKKLNQDDLTKNFKFKEVEVASQAIEESDFTVAQQTESQKIQQVLEASKNSWICHIGGGHDHIFPLLKAAEKTHKKIIVINIDAHADTRTDDHAHSGTPFRQFANETKSEFSLFQIGLHSFANSSSTLAPLRAKNYSILWKRDLLDDEKIKAFFATIKKLIDAETLVIFSIDADALKASEVPGVSAVNVEGISRAELIDLWEEYRKLGTAHSPLLGIYELNPYFDSLSMVSMKTMATFCYEILK